MKKLLLTACLTTLVLGNWGCSKEEAATYPFTILVTSVEGVPVQNATVEVNAPVAPNRMLPDFKGKTDLSGRVTFEYDYEAVLKIKAVRSVDGVFPDWIGCGFVKLEANKSVTARVVIREFDPDRGGC
jgi:hypothetical protein